MRTTGHRDNPRARRSVQVSSVVGRRKSVKATLRDLLIRKAIVAFSRLLDVPNDAFETSSVPNASFGTSGTAWAAVWPAGVL